MIESKLSSGNSTPSSTHHSSDSRRFDSHTTPSPTGYQAPQLDCHALSAKLALYEASQNLSVAADTLAAAAKAMSKAAASLAVASNHFATRAIIDTSRTVHGTRDSPVFFSEPSSPSEGWQQTSYMLSAKRVEEPGAEDVTRTPPIQNSHPDLSLSEETASPTIDIPSSSPAVSDSVQVGNSLNPDVSKSANSPIKQCGSTPIPVNPSQPASTNAPPPSVNPAANPNKVEKISKLATCSDTTQAPPRSQNVPKSKASAPAPPAKQTKQTSKAAKVSLPPTVPGPSSATSSHSSVVLPNSSIVLDRPFDEIATVALLSQQHPKTICIYKYKESAQTLLDTLTALLGAGKVRIASVQNQASNLRNFSNGTGSILVWPAEFKLNQIWSTVPSSKLQIVHLGDALEENRGLSCAKFFIVTTTQSVNSLSAKQKKELMKKYPFNDISKTCNDQGVNSSLNGFRTVLRARFAKNPSAKRFYTGFISYQRLHHADWSPAQHLKAADEYAREYLLRGISQTKGLMVGGSLSPTLTKQEKAKLGL
ncbi:hypothetical protein RhiJN_08604 [Ceratobasidium sp. AG-Ba]|nr:hypothetical protein RhiJN_08604 [Ceratobasidium sp. AG-Ba]QRW09390.1 hypothetical protein RhiLY_08389 [Ceratobasidium sp. AG-Ba]